MGVKMSKHEALWRNFVTAFANIHKGLYRQQVLHECSFPLNGQYEKENELIRSLTEDQKKTLVDLLESARDSGIHDALVVLNDRMVLKSGEYREGNCVMEFQPYATTLYQDYVLLRDGHGWPEKE
jgi:hypothetical protein